VMANAPKASAKRERAEDDLLSPLSFRCYR
jgi:hypothetical protein